MIVIDDIGYATLPIPGGPPAPAPGAGPPPHLRHPLRDVPDLRPPRVPLSAGPQARAPPLCELPGAGRPHRGLLRASGAGLRRPRRGRSLAGNAGPVAHPGREESIGAVDHPPVTPPAV